MGFRLGNETGAGRQTPTVGLTGHSAEPWAPSCSGPASHLLAGDSQPRGAAHMQCWGDKTPCQRKQRLP